LKENMTANQGEELGTVSLHFFKLCSREFQCFSRASRLWMRLGMGSHFSSPMFLFLLLGEKFDQPEKY
jgi:hypothetical protein